MTNMTHTVIKSLGPCAPDDFPEDTCIAFVAHYDTQLKWLLTETPEINLNHHRKSLRVFEFFNAFLFWASHVLGG